MLNTCLQYFASDGVHLVKMVVRGIQIFCNTQEVEI